MTVQEIKELFKKLDEVSKEVGREDVVYEVVEDQLIIRWKRFMIGEKIPLWWVLLPTEEIINKIKEQRIQRSKDYEEQKRLEELEEKSRKERFEKEEYERLRAKFEK